MNRNQSQPLDLRITEFIMRIPLLNIMFFAFLFCVEKAGSFILYHWRTEKDAISEFLSLPVIATPPLFHLHIYVRRSQVVSDGVFVMGIDVGSRFGIFSIPIISDDVVARTLIPQIIKELCQSIIRLNMDTPPGCLPRGRPGLITTPDFIIYTELCKTISGHGTTLLRKADSEIMIRNSSTNRHSNDNWMPLSSVTDAHSTSIDRASGLIMRGMNIDPSSFHVNESYRPSKKKRGKYKSTVKKENSDVPQSVGFCAFCGKLHLDKKLLTCSKCKEAVYCSRKCQKQDWEEGGLWRPHKELCKLLRE